MNEILPVVDTNIVRYADFFKLTTPSGTYYFSTAPYDITVAGVGTFTALGQLIQVSSAQRDIKSTANETTITLVGIDTTMLGLVLSSDIKGSQIQLWHGFFNSNNQLLTISAVNWVNSSSLTIPWKNTSSKQISWQSSAAGNGLYQYFNGYVNSFSISEQWTEEVRQYTGAVTLSASSFQLILQNRTSGRYTNDNAWQSVNPGDTSMNRINFISNINYAFGREPQNKPLSRLLNNAS
jgi:hypothetical protein